MAITYNAGTNIITVTGYTEATPCTFLNIYNADKAGTLSLHARTGITGTDGTPIAVDRAERPTDYIVLGGGSNDLYITIANWNGTTATIRITGTDRDGGVQTEDIVITANGNYSTTKWFKTITYTQIIIFTATSFDYNLIQGQWGVVWRECINQFCFDASIQFGDGSIITWFKDTNKQLLMKSGDITLYSTYKSSMVVKPLANCYFGELQDATNKIGKNGCIVYYNYTNTYRKFGINVFGSGNLYLYASKFYGNQPFGFGSQYNSPAHTGNFIVYDCVFNKRVLTQSANSDLNNIIINLENTTDNALMCGGGTATKIQIFGITTLGAIYPYGGSDMIVKDAFLRDCANIAQLSSTSGGDLYLVNADTDTWTIHWWNSNNYVIYRQYDFNLKVQDKDENAINGATIKIWDKNDNLVVNTTTNVNGVITTQTVTRGYYDFSNDDTLQEASPHIIQISKAGYETYKKKWTIDEKTRWVIALYTPKRRFDSLEG